MRVTWSLSFSTRCDWICFLNVGIFGQIRQLCRVVYRKFDFSRYPGHVRKLGTYAFKPIVIHVSRCSLYISSSHYAHIYEKVWRKRISFVSIHCIVVEGASGNAPSSSIWPHLSYGLVRSKREYYHNCSLAVFLCSFLTGFTHCAKVILCVRLLSCIISACML